MAKITKNTAAKPAAKKPAAKPAVKKEKNPDAFLNKFGMPVIKLGLVGALTAGVIGFTNELTKDAIATNIYNQKVLAYKTTGEALEGWTFNGEEKLEANYGLYGEADEDFGIFDLSMVSEKMPSTTFVQEMMVYCETSTGSDCNADASDTAGFGFMAIGNHGGYGEMKMLITTDKDGIIKSWEHLGFVTSFSAQTANTFKAMDGMVDSPLEGGSYVSGASTSVTNSGVISMINEMKVVYDEVAVDPVVTASGYIAASHGTSFIDTATLNTRINESTTVFAGANLDEDLLLAASFADGSFMFIMNWTNGFHGNIVLFDVAADGTFTWDAVGTDGDLATTDEDFGHRDARDWLNGNKTTGFNVMSVLDPIAGSSSTVKAANKIADSAKLVWTNKGGTA